MKNKKLGKFLNDLKQGLGKALRSTKTFLAGGDLCSSSKEVSFSVTVIGEGLKKTYCVEV